MSLIQDHISVTRPTRVLLGTDRNTAEVRQMTVVQEVLAEWWVPAGQDLTLEPWLEAGVREQGWEVHRKEGAHLVLDVAGDPDVNWRAVAYALAEAIETPDPDPMVLIERALDRYRLAEMVDPPLPEPEPEET